MWIKKSMPALPGYESLGDSVEAKRWLDFKLGELLAADDDLLDYITSKTPGSGLGIETRENVCNFVISAIDYPMFLGMPTDIHKDNWFSGLCCHKITLDYWQTARETLRTLRLNKRDFKPGYGDCDDVSVLFTAIFLALHFSAWECIGYVLEGGQILGGHGWAIFKDDTGVCRLYEATLSEPPTYPDGYPEIDPESIEWQVGSLTYQGFAKFNREEYYENEEAEDPLKALRIGFRGKETRKKHEAITKAWGIKTKPLRRPSLLTKLRWRR